MEEDPKWKKAFIRQEFLKLYFDYLGVNDNLSVEKLTDTYEIARSKVNQNFLFAIVKTRIKDTPGDSYRKKECANLKEVDVPILVNSTLILVFNKQYGH
jgi:hypothetical protein